jgi:hypothetical protein
MANEVTKVGNEGVEDETCRGGKVGQGGREVGVTEIGQRLQGQGAIKLSN